MKRNRYKLSRNYKWLKKLLDAGLDVVCFVDYKCDGMLFRDVCMARFEPREDKDFEHYSLGVRGIEYLRFTPSNTKYEHYPKSFEVMMRLHNVEFIEIEQ